MGGTAGGRDEDHEKCHDWQRVPNSLPGSATLAVMVWRRHRGTE